jgi:hypothetical protein
MVGELPRLAHETHIHVSAGRPPVARRFRGSSQKRVADPLTPCLKQDDPGVIRNSTRRADEDVRATEPQDLHTQGRSQRAGATSEGFGNLSVEDDAKGTVNPADLARSGDSDDDAVDS